MELTASVATERNWCNFCPDLILEGEAVETAPDLKNPLGEQGYAHADCATRKGHSVAGAQEPAGPEAHLRRAFRGSVDSVTFGEDESPPLVDEVADMISDAFGRSTIDADRELAEEIIAKVLRS